MSAQEAGARTTRTPLSPMQRMTIAALRRGQGAAVPVTITAQARADALLAAHAARRAAAPPDAPRVTLTALLAHLLVGALMDHAALRRTLADEETLAIHEDVSLGIAVAREDGSLIVPVIHAAAALDVEQLAAALHDRAARARGGELTLAEVKGATFTLSSTGAIRIPVLGTPLLTAGQSGILLVGAAAPAAVVEPDGTLAAGHLLPLSLTFDHGVVNGMPALEFLADLVGRIENPTERLGRSGGEGR